MVSRGCKATPPPSFPDPFLSYRGLVRRDDPPPIDFRNTLGMAVFGLGMAGRVVVEGALHPRGLLIEAYVPASSET